MQILQRATLRLRCFNAEGRPYWLSNDFDYYVRWWLISISSHIYFSFVVVAIFLMLTTPICLVSSAISRVTVPVILIRSCYNFLVFIHSFFACPPARTRFWYSLKSKLRILEPFLCSIRFKYSLVSFIKQRFHIQLLNKNILVLLC